MHLKHCRNLFGLEVLPTGRVNSPHLTLTIGKSDIHLLCLISSSYSQWRKTQTSGNGLIHPSISEMSCSLEDPVCFHWLWRGDQHPRQPAWIRNLPPRHVTFHETHLPPQIFRISLKISQVLLQLQILLFHIYASRKRVLISSVPLLL